MSSMSESQGVASVRSRRRECWIRFALASVALLDIPTVAPKRSLKFLRGDAPQSIPHALRIRRNPTALGGYSGTTIARHGRRGGQAGRMGWLEQSGSAGVSRRGAARRGLCAVSGPGGTQAPGCETAQRLGQPGSGSRLASRRGYVPSGAHGPVPQRHLRRFVNAFHKKAKHGAATPRPEIELIAQAEGSGAALTRERRGVDG